MMNFWGTPEGHKPQRLYLEVADPSDGSLLTSMLMLDTRVARAPMTFAWWASRAASAEPTTGDAR